MEKRTNNDRKTMNISLLMLLFITALLGTPAKGDLTQIPSGDACFTQVFVTNGNGEIDLVNGGVAKVYSHQAPVWVNFTVRNENCSDDGFSYADFVVNVTEDGITNSWPLERVLKGNYKTLPLAYPFGIAGPKTVNLRAELFWNQSGFYVLEDIREFSIQVVWLSIKENGVEPSLVEIWQTDNFALAVKVKNIGNDVAYATNVTVRDSGGLSVIGDTSQFLGDLNASETGTITFNFSVPSDASLGVHTIVFTCLYRDFSQTAQNNSITAEIMVKEADLKESTKNLIDQLRLEIERSQISGYLNAEAQAKFDEASVEYEKAVSTYQLGNYTYAEYYANNAISLLQDANRIEIIYRVPIYLVFILAAIAVITGIYVLIKNRSKAQFS